METLHFQINPAPCWAPPVKNLFKDLVENLLILSKA
jgi:hypothetical protein